MSLGNVPLGLKAAKPYVKIGLELYKSRPVVAYHCFSYAITLGLKTDYKHDAALRSYLMNLMDYVEKIKQALIKQEDLVDSVTKDLEGFVSFLNNLKVCITICFFYYKHISVNSDCSSLMDLVHINYFFKSKVNL